MAPACLACRQQLVWLFVIVLCFSMILQYASTALVYDRLTLLTIRNSVGKLIKQDLAKASTCAPPFEFTIPESLRRPAYAAPGRKRRRRRGKRGGVSIRWKLYLASSAVPRSGSSVFRHGLVSDRCSSRRCWDRGVVGPVVPAFDSAPSQVFLPRLHRRGVNSANLRPLCQVSQLAYESICVKMALVNSRSVVNKTFILNDFFTSQCLDFLFLTETWIKVGDLSPFTELVPPDCDFLSSPRTAGRGGGLASVFKKKFDCRSIKTDTFSSFEVQLMQIDSRNPVCWYTDHRKSTRRYRIMNSETNKDFCTMYEATFSNWYYDCSPSDLCADELLTLFTSVCSNILDSIAPLKTTCFKPKSEPWLNDSTRATRRLCRRAERKWKKDKLQVSYEIFKNRLSNYQKTVKMARVKYFSGLIEKNRGNPRFFFSTLNAVINPPVSESFDVSLQTCENFRIYFSDKISDIRCSIQPPDHDLLVPLVTCPAVFHQFEPVSITSLTEVVKHLRPSISPQDIIPARFFKHVFNVVGHSILILINCCLATGSMPAHFKHAIVQPLLKRSNLDSKELSNFRPISKLPFLSKVLEKVVVIQLQTFLRNNSVLEVFQSGFRALHSTESALLKVHNDILLTLDSGASASLVLLDLSAAFDTVDHNILISRLEHYAGVRGMALQWFKSYLTNRSFAVKVGECLSTSAPLTSGVPQGSILAPLLFSLYMLPLGSIFRKHGVSFHCYADDTQIYMPLQKNDKNALTPLLNCLRDVKSWMALNFLKYNDSKTEIILFGQIENLASVNVHLGPLAAHNKVAVKNLGVWFDRELKFDKQINNVVKSCFFNLRLLAKVKPFLSATDLEKLIHAFIFSRLDYCNTIYIGVNQTALARLQAVQNAAARLLTGTPKHEHITPILFSLKWLPVRFRIEYKLLVFVFKSLNGLAPTYLDALVKHHTSARSLRSSDQQLLTIPRARLKLKGDRAFSVAAPKLWNLLPVSIRSAQTISSFKLLLKTYLLTQAFNLSEC